MTPEFPIKTIPNLPPGMVICATTEPRDDEERRVMAVLPFLAYVAWLAQERPGRVVIMKNVGAR